MLVARIGRTLDINLFVTEGALNLTLAGGSA
jgi:hypothetical protein